MILCTNPELSRIWDRLLREFPDLPKNSTWVRMSRRQQVFYLVFWLDCELQNGGIMQFIDNSGGDLYFETIDALLAIGSVRSAVWMTYVQEALGLSVAPDRETRLDQLAGADVARFESIADDAFERVRRELGEWQQEEDEMKLLAYVRKEPLFHN